MKSVISMAIKQIVLGIGEWNTLEHWFRIRLWWRIQLKKKVGNKCEGNEIHDDGKWIEEKQHHYKKGSNGTSKYKIMQIPNSLNHGGAWHIWYLLTSHKARSAMISYFLECFLNIISKYGKLCFPLKTNLMNHKKTIFIIM